jgi:hypothetical protein
MIADLSPLRVLLVTLAGWINRHQQDVIELSFAKTSSDSLGTIRNPRARRAGLEIERPVSSDRRPCTVPADSRWMSESGQAALDR